MVHSIKYKKFLQKLRLHKNTNTLTKITRLRLEHTSIPHRHILKLPLTHKCACINIEFTVQHILEECQVYAPKIKNVLGHEKITFLLKNPNVEDIILIRQSLQKITSNCKLQQNNC